MTAFHVCRVVCCLWQLQTLITQCHHPRRLNAMPVLVVSSISFKWLTRSSLPEAGSILCSSKFQCQFNYFMQSDCKKTAVQGSQDRNGPLTKGCLMNLARPLHLLPGMIFSQPVKLQLFGLESVNLIFAFTQIKISQLSAA